MVGRMEEGKGMKCVTGRPDMLLSYIARTQTAQWLVQWHASDGHCWAMLALFSTYRLHWYVIGCSSYWPKPGLSLAPSNC